MTPRQLPWKWLVLGLAGLLLVSLILIPRLIGDQSAIGTRVAAALSAWSGGQAKFVGPVSVSYFPDFAVDGKLVLRGGHLPLISSIVSKHAKISLDLADMLRGRVSIDALKLVRPTIMLKATPDTSTPTESPEMLLSELVESSPVKALHVREGVIRSEASPDKAPIRHINVHVDTGDPDTGLSAFGSFAWRTEVVRFSLDAGVPVDDGAFPVTLNVSSGPGTLKLNGSASLSKGLSVDGDLKAENANVRELLRWVGWPVSDGSSLTSVSASGGFHYAGSMLTFDDGSFVIDGNSAVGLLAVSAATPRPRVDGTLAFDRLILDPYLHLDSSTGANADATKVVPAEQRDWSLVQDFDADLRISAGEIDIGSFKLGRGGFTLTAKRGAIAAEIGEIELCGGTIAGRFGADLSQPAKRIDLVASLANATVDTCLPPGMANIPLKGTGGVKAEISTQGHDLPELVRGLSGSLKIAAQNGVVPVDFARLAAPSPPLDGSGWTRDSGTGFDSLTADCHLGAGHIWCPMLNMQTPRGIVSGAGDLDLLAENLDWNLSVAPATTGLNDLREGESDRPKIAIRGTLAEPLIRRSDLPTYGEGTIPTGSVPPAATPH